MDGLHFVAKPLWDVVDESCDEAEFFWRAWESDLVSHARNLRATWLWTEDRLQGALDGIRVGGARIFSERLHSFVASDQPFACAVAAHVAIGLGGEAHVLLSRAMSSASPVKRRWLHRGVEVATSATMRAKVDEFLDAYADVALRVAVHSFRGEAPSRDLVASLAGGAAADRALAMSAARWLPATQAHKLIAPGLLDADDAVVAAAVESGLILGVPSAGEACRALVRRGRCKDAFAWLAALEGTQAEPQLEAALGDAATAAHALAALGFLGTRHAADMAIEAMHAQSDTNVRLAAEAFAAATGLDMRRLGFIAAEPPLPDEAISFERDDLTADLVPKPDDLLPLPDVGGIARWWQAQRPSFIPEQRYIAGQPLSPEALHGALSAGPMRRRHVIAFELAARTRGACHVQTRGFFHQQRQQLAETGHRLLHDEVSFVATGGA